ncbi:MAG: nitrous oxide reductase family maturation protein NosD [Ilumatobacter sp.]
MRSRLRRLAGAATAAVLIAIAGWVVIDAVEVERIDGSAVVSQPADRVSTRPASPTTPGPLSSPHPTIEHLSVVWDTVGDANGNGQVTVRYRDVTATPWQSALPLRRVPAGDNEGLVWSARHVGSIFGLRPGATYEIEARFVDPDGPDDRRVISATTRQVPVAMPGAPVTVASPSTLSSVLSRVSAGEIIELAAGTYDGFTVERSGEPSKPIVIRGRPGATVNGEVGVFEQAHVHIDNLTIIGRIRFNGSSNVAITRNTITATRELDGHGIVTFLPASDGYIADNTINGLTPWRESSLGVNGDNLGEGILVTGPGHVIEHNRVSGMRDGISLLEDGDAIDQFSIDIMNNDVSESADDGIEADFCRHNCRIVGNRVTNSFIAMSSQPGLGGPTYFVNNTIYNVAHVAFKLYRGSQGDVLLHNTVVKGGDAFGVYAGRPVSHLFMRNNLFIGGPGASYNGYSNGAGRVFDVADLDEHSVDADHDGFGSTIDSFSGRFGSVRFDNISEFRSSTTERNALQVSLDVFQANVDAPTNAMTMYGPPDLRVDPTSPAASAAEPVENVGFAHIGARPVPFGPR